MWGFCSPSSEMLVIGNGFGDAIEKAMVPKLIPAWKRCRRRWYTYITDKLPMFLDLLHKPCERWVDPQERRLFPICQKYKINAVPPIKMVV